MNEDSYKKEKYVRLLNRLNQIKSELDTVNNVFNDIHNICKSAVKINNECMESELFIRIKNNTANCISNITNTISNIHSKI